MIDIDTLTKDVSAYLLPFLPFLWETGKGAVDQATQGALQKFGADAWDKAKSLWHPLKPKVESRKALQDAVIDVVAEPVDEDLQAVLRTQLKKLFQEDPTFAQEMAELFAKVKVGGANAIGNRSVAIKGNVSESNIFTGNGNSMGSTYYFNGSQIVAVDSGAPANNSLMTEQLAIDRTLFQKIREMLPHDGSILLLREHSIGNVGFRESRLKQIRDYYDFAQNNPNFEFMDLELESTSQTLFEKTENFFNLLCGLSFLEPLRKEIRMESDEDFYRLPPHWKYSHDEELVEKYYGDIEKIDSAATEVAKAYDNFIRLGRKKLSVP